MSYSAVDIVNMAYQRAGARGNITALTDTTNPLAVKANTIYPYVLDEVLQLIKPKFATTRVELAKSSTTPADGYDYAYPLPADYLAMAPTRKGREPINPTGYPYEVETLPDGTLCLVTDYDNSSDALYLTYVRRVNNPAKFAPSFVNALIFRLSGEFALSTTDSSMSKYQLLMSLYDAAARIAKGEDRGQDSLEDETGNTDWETAGR